MLADLTAGVGFDLDHTLVLDNKLERVAFLRLLERVLDDGGRIAGTLADEIERIDDLLARQRGGAFSIDDAVNRFVTERGLPADPAYARVFREMALEMVEQFVVPLPGARATLSALAERGIPAVVLSNGWNPLQIHKARRAGFTGTVLASADIGERKPDARAFEAMLRALGTAPQQTWYVGDDPHADVEGARSAGLNAVWLDAEGKRFPAELVPPPQRIHALEELLGLLPAPVEAL